MDTKTTQSFCLTVKDCTYHDVVVDAPDLDTAVEIVREQWLNGELSTGNHGFVVLLDEEDDEVEEFACW
jgi:hypothetical protein